MPQEIENSEEGLRIKCKPSIREIDLRDTGQKNVHTSIYPWDWLYRHSYRPRLEKKKTRPLHLWGSEIMESPPTADYKEVMVSDAGVAKWTANIEGYGFSFIDGVPSTPEATQKLVERIAFVKPTHYGGFWDFTSNLDHKDTAYTTLALKAHTDTTYFTQPAGLQIFHLLEFDGRGGESLLVDGFRAAKVLREQHPDAYKLLSKIRIPTHSAGDENVCIQPSVDYGLPVLNHDPTTADLYQIRWNNNDRSTMNFWGEGESVEEFYNAIKKWDTVLTMKENEFWEQLRPGRALSMSFHHLYY
ncbi:Trimethyllysine dioxygenase [Neolecta irregularis DAH-3]|uniref:Trimethyllysine dioxygenase n=1 Tax=Neolecta irregularis (strain DAH-3) TaxID=1198029 RepID=A0A1U7LUB7_NEOID|nr:Trimethyllysine dioxygenase [Neolecta irregularis DAH-3]|eukprot:OLL26257.1 Trimethyllysine dioxygenase [Neolecta irregularis DAH-3]